MVSSHKSVKHDLPLQLGFFVYNYAKLKMLSFYYDVLEKYIDRADFNLLEMDTGTLMQYGSRFEIMLLYTYVHYVSGIKSKST